MFGKWLLSLLAPIALAASRLFLRRAKEPADHGAVSGGARDRGCGGGAVVPGATAGGAAFPLTVNTTGLLLLLIFFRYLAVLRLKSVND